MGHRSSIVTYHARLAASSSKRHVRSSNINGATMTRYYMGLTDPARYLGITVGALASLDLPKPDAQVGRTRGWTKATIDQWNAQHPGHGGRPKEK